jgi:hypothetical protein
VFASCQLLYLPTSMLFMIGCFKMQLARMLHPVNFKLKIRC